MPLRILKHDMMDAISIYFRNIGEYGPYRSERSTKRELENIIRQYNINMDALMPEVAIERERRAKEREETLMTLRNMTDEQREKFSEYINQIIANPFNIENNL
jgi:hypothetical protein